MPACTAILGFFSNTYNLGVFECRYCVMPLASLNEQFVDGTSCNSRNVSLQVRTLTLSCTLSNASTALHSPREEAFCARLRRRSYGWPPKSTIITLKQKSRPIVEEQ